MHLPVGWPCGRQSPVTTTNLQRLPGSGATPLSHSESCGRRYLLDRGRAGRSSPPFVPEPRLCRHRSIKNVCSLYGLQWSHDFDDAPGVRCGDNGCISLPEVTFVWVAVITRSADNEIAFFLIPSGVCNSGALHLDSFYAESISKRVAFGGILQQLVCRRNRPVKHTGLAWPPLGINGVGHHGRIGRPLP